MNISKKLDAVLRKYNLLPPCGKMQMLRKIKKDRAEWTDNMWWVDFNTELKSVTPDYEKVINELDGVLDLFGLKIGGNICYGTGSQNICGRIARFWRNDPQDREPNKWYVGAADYSITLRPWRVQTPKDVYDFWGGSSRYSRGINIDGLNEKYFIDCPPSRKLGALMADLTVRHHLDTQRHYDVWICGMGKDGKVDAGKPFVCCHFNEHNRQGDIDKWFEFEVEDYRFEFSKNDANDTNTYAEYLAYDEEKDEDYVTEEIIRNTPHNQYWLFVKLDGINKLN